MTPTTAGHEGLRVDDLTVRYGGLVAVDRNTLHAPLGAITGLIGPNGAGKTTTFNACTGLVRPSGGTVHLFGRDITSATPPERARLGLGRTFQQMELFDSLSVEENVSMGCEAQRAGRLPWTHILSSREQRRSIRESTAEALQLCDIAELADARPADLPTGKRRLVDLARVVAGGFRLLLLDEPSSGLDAVETERFGSILKRLVAERAVGMLCVEHDMALVMTMCDYIYVIDFGVAIFEGTPEEVRHSPIVRAAYLGDDAVEENPRRAS